MDNMRILPAGSGFDYVNSGPPTAVVNPNRPFVTWLDMSTGEIFVCKDATSGANVWVGQLGTSIGL